MPAGSIVTVNGAIEEATTLLANPGMASMTRRAVPAVVLTDPTSGVLATFELEAAFARVRFTVNVLASADNTTKAPLTCRWAPPAVAAPSITTVSPTSKPWPLEVSVATLLAIAMLERFFAVSASSATVM